MTVTATAPAKINLTFQVLCRRSDGYHDVDTVMQAVDLFETVTVEVLPVCDGEIDIEMRGSYCANLVEPQDNIVYKAAKLFFQHNQICAANNIKIIVHKRIPVGAGLAGGSADAAACLTALNYAFGTVMTTDELCRLGGVLGCDVPFCICGGTMHGTGDGTILVPSRCLCDMQGVHIVLVKPSESISTLLAYNEIDRHDIGVDYDRSADMMNAIKTGNVSEVGRALFNHFEAVLKPKFTEKIEGVFTEFGALGSSMTGSGSAVFGIYDDKAAAEKALEVFKNLGYDTHLVAPYNSGAKILNPIV